MPPRRSSSRRHGGSATSPRSRSGRSRASTSAWDGRRRRWRGSRGLAAAGPGERPPVREGRLRSRARRGGRARKPDGDRARRRCSSSSASRARRRRRGRSRSWRAAAGCSPPVTPRSATSSRPCAGTVRARVRSTARGRSSCSASTCAATGAARQARAHLRSALDGVRAPGRRRLGRARPRRAARERRDRPQAQSERARPAHAAGAPDHPLGGRGRHQQGSRGAAVPQPAHDRLPPAQDLHQARHLVTRRAHPQQPRGRRRHGVGVADPSRLTARLATSPTRVAARGCDGHSRLPTTEDRPWTSSSSPTRTRERRPTAVRASRS